MASDANSPSFFTTLSVCGLRELDDYHSRNVTVALSLVDPAHELGHNFAPGINNEIFRFHDIIEPKEGMTAPTEKDVEGILRFGSVHSPEHGAGHLLVHCHMGVSRSTAAMLMLMAQRFPDLPADALFEKLREIRSIAWPNSTMISMADDALGRRGRLVEALRRHYGVQLNVHPRYRKWMTELGRVSEVESAIT